MTIFLHSNKDCVELEIWQNSSWSKSKCCLKPDFCYTLIKISHWLLLHFFFIFQLAFTLDLYFFKYFPFSIFLCFCFIKLAICTQRTVTNFYYTTLLTLPSGENKKPFHRHSIIWSNTIFWAQLAILRPSCISKCTFQKFHKVWDILKSDTIVKAVLKDYNLDIWPYFTNDQILVKLLKIFWCEICH